MPHTSILRDNLARVALSSEFKYHNWFYQNVVLPFNIEAQTQSNWCWAATAKSVSHFYSGLSPWTQCKIASKELNQSCCTTPVPGPCNVPWYLNKALDRTLNFVSMQNGTISWSEIKNQIDQGLVVGARIGWNGGGGHFMVIYGVSRVFLNEYLYIDDPIYGKSVLTYDEFANNYQSAGSWSHTYFTKKHFYFMWLKDLQFDPRLLSPIPEVRPFARFNDPKFSVNQEIADPEYATAHHTFVMGLNDISSDSRLPERPVSLRVMEFQDDAPLAMYEVGLNEDHPQFLQLQINKDYFSSFENALNRLKSEGKDEYPGELRVVRVPALNVEAVWVHYDDAKQDKFVLVRQFGEEGTKLFSAAEFMKYLNRLKAQLGDMDDLKGAGGA